MNSTLTRTLSTPRLHAYRVADRGEHDALCRYLWNTALCESLYPVLQILEVSFRNAVHAEISASPAGAAWVNSESGFLGPYERRRIAEAKNSLEVKGKVITEPSLVAELNFGFWTSLLHTRYERMWSRIISGVFPHMPQRIRTRQEAAERMSAVRKLRNAALHHHSIWDWCNLEKQHQNIHALVGWVCPTAATMASGLDRFPSVYARRTVQFRELATLVLN